jgi:hypothetical protein
MLEKEIPELEQLQNPQRAADQAQECFGIVVILDALGAKSLTINGAREFLKLRDVLAIDIPFLHNAIHSTVAEFVDTPTNASINHEYSDVIDQIRQSRHEVVTFGDSFILLYQCNPQTIRFALASVAHWCALNISAAMDSKVFLRGALSIGSYLYGGSQSNTVLGPAVADAATWCDLADWIGVVVTPSTGYYLEQSAINPNELRHHSQFHFFKQQYYFKYQVPLKGNHQENLWTLMWPCNFFDHEKPDSIKQRLATTFAGTSMPRGSESKYANTWEYVNWLWAKSLEWERQGQNHQSCNSKT